MTTPTSSPRIKLVIHIDRDEAGYSAELIATLGRSRVAGWRGRGKTPLGAVRSVMTHVKDAAVRRPGQRPSLHDAARTLVFGVTTSKRQ